MPRYSAELLGSGEKHEFKSVPSLLKFINAHRGSKGKRNVGPKGLKKILLIYSNGKEIGMFNEAGSVYANQVIAVERDGQWLAITNYPQAMPDQDDMLDQVISGIKYNGF